MYKVILSAEGTNIQLPPRTDYPQFTTDSGADFDSIAQEHSREKAHQLIDLFFDDLEVEVMETEEKQEAA